jgi:Alr-MurF fusion protein
MYFLKEIADITHSKLIGENKEVKVFLTDSRAFVSADKLLFVALKSGKNDGHKYIPELINKGVKSFLIADPKFDMSRFDQHDVSFLVSEDPLDSLQKLAIHHRKKFAIPVIGITGSNGKTVVKEWLYQLLKHNYAICRSPKSFNSQLGVPLSVLNLDESHTLGIFEAGISESGEMQKLVNIIQPTLGIITSIGSAHDEGFKNRDEKINEKLRLVEYCDQIFINGIEKPSLPSYLHDRSLVIAENKSADLIFSFANEQLHLVGKDSNQNKIELILNPQCTDNASISNICTCVAVLLHLGYSPTDIAEKIKLLQPIALRLEIKNGINNSLIINDFYNSDLDSLKIALSFLSQQSRKEKKIVVVSDIEQSGVSDNQLYSEIAKLMSYHQIDHVVGIGRKISDYRNHFSMNSDFFGSTEEFLQKFTGIRSQFENSTTLLKGLVLRV